MAKKRTNSNRSRGNRTRNKKESVSSKEEISEIAEEVLNGVDKNPYYYGSITIQNFDQLQNHLQNFSVQEAGWLADWIDYLGDTRTAVQIREAPTEFKNIINKRYIELKKAIEE